MGARDQERRNLAWIHFCDLENQGVKPNANALYNHYIKTNREHPELRPTIPSTNRSTIYEWAREDKWDERYAELKRAEAEKSAEKYALVRNQGYGTLVGLQGMAIQTLMELAASDGINPKVRLEAAESILDRTGLGRMPAKPQKEEAGPKPEAPKPPPITEETSMEELTAFVLNKGGSSYNA